MRGVAMKFDAIVFDFDGVLVESVDVKTQAFAAIYEPFGTDVMRRVVEWHLAHGGVSRFDKFRHFHREFLGQPLGAIEEQNLGRRFSQMVEEAVVESPWVPGAREFLEANYASIPLYLASGTPQEELRRIVARRDMAQYFRGIFGSPAKKDRILSNILTLERLAPERVLMVGDATTDLEGASQVGTAFIGRVPADKPNPFPTGTITIKTLEPLSALCA